MVVAATALIGTGWLFYDRITTSRTTQADTNAAIRTVLCFARTKAIHDDSLTPERRARAVHFYDQALRKISEPLCNQPPKEKP